MTPRTLIVTVALGALLVISCGEGQLTQSAGTRSTPADQATDQNNAVAVNQEGVAVSGPDNTTPQPAGPGPATGGSSGASPPGAATDGSSTEGPSTTGTAAGVAPDAAAAALGVDLQLPAGLVAVALSDAYLRSLIPTPSTGLRFLPQERADSDLGELEPADLELRVYDLAAARDLESWLEETGLTATASISDQQTSSGLSGKSVCPSTMLSPGCSFVVTNGSGRRVYQFLAMSAEAESAIDSARLR